KYSSRIYFPVRVNGHPHITTRRARKGYFIWILNLQNSSGICINIKDGEGNAGANGEKVNIACAVSLSIKTYAHGSSCRAYCKRTKIEKLSISYFYRNRHGRLLLGLHNSNGKKSDYNCEKPEVRNFNWHDSFLFIYQYFFRIALAVDIQVDKINS